MRRSAFKLKLTQVLACMTILYLIVVHTDYSRSQEQHPVGINWQKGPVKVSLGDFATINVPAGYKFADAAGAKRLLELTQNPTSGNEVGVIVPILEPGAQNKDWFVLFDFHETGYISDAEKGSLDSSAILKSIQTATENENEVRKGKGWSAFHVVGWSEPPFYDEKTHNLTWAVLGKDDSAATTETVNHSVRLLGRRGSMSVDLVLAPNDLAAVVPQFNQLLETFSYTTGNRYAEFVKGDKIAGYGLTALIAGGAAAAAVKTGLFAKLLKVILASAVALWKLILVIIAGIISRLKKLGNWLRNLFRKNSAVPSSITIDERPMLLPTTGDE